MTQSEQIGEDGVVRIGNSEISVWSQCRRKWYLTYYRNLTEREKKHTGALALGSRIHSALEGYYRGLQTGDSPDLLEIHSGLVEADRLDLMMAGYDASDLDKEADLGRVMLEDYLQWVDEDALDAGMDIVGVEHTLSIPLADGRAVLSGKVDLAMVDRRTGVPHMNDFKTSANFQSLLSTAHMSPQLKTYVALYAHEHPESTDGGALAGTYRILKKSKRTARATPPFHLEHTVRYNRETLANHLVHTETKVSEILAARDALDAGGDHHTLVPPNVSSACSWGCPFITVCPLFDDGSAVEEAIDERYAVHDPYAYRLGDAALDAI